MSTTLVTNIGELVTNDPASGRSHGVDDTAGQGRLGLIRDAAVVVEDGRIAWVGAVTDAPDADARLDVEGRAVVPAFVDSHNHLVFDGDRSAEFAARMTGARYDGGGIANTVRPTREASDKRLRELVRARVEQARTQGTGVLEIKSGYGLTIADEARALRVAGEFTDETTYLGAHVVPADADRREYVDLVTGAMLDACAPHARWVDVFCEPHSAHAFDGDETREILAAAVAKGLMPRLHAGQLGEGPGCSSPSSSTRPASTTARSCRPKTLRHWQVHRPSRRCCPASSSAHVSRTRAGATSSTPASRWPSRPTATPVPASPTRSRSSSRWPCARWA